MSKPRAYVLSEAARYLGAKYPRHRISITQVCRLIASGALVESDEVRGIRTVTAKSLAALCKSRGLPPPNGDSR